MTILIPAQTTASVPQYRNNDNTGSATSADHAFPPTSTQQVSALPASFKLTSNTQLAKSLMVHFNDFENSPESNRISIKSLEKIAAGKLPDGRDATPEQMELAKEILSRPELTQSLDRDLEGKEDGNLHWNDIAVLAEDFESLSDRYLVNQTKVYFHELTTGVDDTYVNFTELKEAAGEQTSTRTFSPQASAVARALLKRPILLDELDRGVDWTGGPGKKDGRFDLTNINYVYSRSENDPAREFPVGKIGGGRN